ncbi:hypothetical protein TNCV_1578961 [Trichonephila clavipes]|nr:hypothetical protein TNCV_1578961 [Trichonephila clavipes]
MPFTESVHEKNRNIKSETTNHSLRTINVEGIQRRRAEIRKGVPTQVLSSFLEQALSPRIGGFPPLGLHVLSNWYIRSVKSKDGQNRRFSQIQMCRIAERSRLKCDSVNYHYLARQGIGNKSRKIGTHLDDEDGGENWMLWEPI